MIILHSIFSDGMILQAERPACLFGSGVGKIKATVSGITVSAEAIDGKFLIALPVHQYGEAVDIILSDEESEIVLHHVLFGDVYLFAGQSNMGFQLSSAHMDGEICDNEQIRVFSFGTVQNNQRFTANDGWIPITKDTAPDVSALAYFTSQALFKKKKQPIGLITAYQGASIIESWMSKTALEELDIHLPESELFPDHYMEEYSAWNKDSIMYERDILPIMPYSLAGVVWYQGESNTGAGESKLYDRFLAKLVTSWRKEFCDDTLPFVIVQIADCEERDCPAWREIQKRQELVCNSLDGCQLVISRDVSETDDIHPPTKHLLAARICEQLYKTKNSRFLLGIDGGGTKTHLILTDLDMNIIRELRTDCSNPIDIGIDKAKEILREAILEICREIPLKNVVAFAGIAGGSSSNMKAELEKFFGELGLCAFENDSDIRNLIAAGLGNKDGITMIMGTGICAFSQKNGIRKRTAGWGYLFDDGGCGYNIGRDGLAAHFRASDGSGPKTKISEIIKKQYPDEQVLLGELYREGKRRIASFSPIVFEAAEGGDTTAMEIIKRNMQFAGHIIESAAEVFEQKPVQVILTGGVLAHPLTLQYLKKALSDSERYHIEILSCPPAIGAVKIAKEIAEKK